LVLLHEQISATIRMDVNKLDILNPFIPQIDLLCL